MVSRNSTIYLLLIFLIAQFYIAITPVFEAFDEDAHYSYVKQIASEMKIPPKKDILIDRAVAEYSGPKAYTSGEGPYDRGLTYAKFFEEEMHLKLFLEKESASKSSIEFIPSRKINWESQHPALYYMFLAPVQKVIAGNSIKFQVYILRSASLMIFIAALYICIRAIEINKIFTQESKNIILTGYYMYPFVFPMCILEFSRIGNDSLCILILSLIFYQYIIGEYTNYKVQALTGLYLGLGLITKAFFLPITATLLCYQVYVDVKKGLSIKEIFLKILQVLLPFLLVLIVYSAVTGSGFTSITGSNLEADFIKTNIILGGEFSFDSFYKIIRGLLTILVTFFWAGTWSLPHIPYLLYIPALFFILILVTRSLENVNYRFKSLTNLTYSLFAIFILGLLWHVFTNFYMSSNPNTPGWYLHILMPFSAAVLGYKITIFKKLKYGSVFFKYGLIYIQLFTAIACLLNIGLYAGCISKGPDKHYSFEPFLNCQADFSIIYKNLSMISYPNICLLIFIPILLFGIYFYKSSNINAK